MENPAKVDLTEIEFIISTFRENKRSFSKLSNLVYAHFGVQPPIDGVVNSESELARYIQYSADPEYWKKETETSYNDLGIINTTKAVA